jgi:hypothetical protein
MIVVSCLIYFFLFPSFENRLLKKFLFGVSLGESLIVSLGESLGVSLGESLSVSLDESISSSLGDSDSVSGSSWAGE